MPAIDAIVAGPDLILVRRGDVENGEGVRRWDIFDGSHRAVGQVALPARFSPRAIHGRRVYGVMRDEMDVPVLIGMELTPPAPR
jgi:hypothetical protein